MTCFLVLGTPRSGTNAVAGVLHHLGIYMGDRFIVDDPEWNAKGFFQCADFSELHSEMLNGWSIPPLDARKTITGEQSVRYTQLIKSRDVLHDWGVSGVEVPWMLDDFVKSCLSVKLIATFRPFHESVQSWCARTGDPVAESVHALSRSAYVISDILSRWKDDFLSVNFHTLLDSKVQEIDRIAKFTSKPVTDGAIDFIDSRLRRFGG